MPIKIIDRLPRNLYKLRKILNFYEMVNHYLTPQTIGILSFPVYGILTSIKNNKPHPSFQKRWGFGDRGILFPSFREETCFNLPWSK
jgi:hypothetical protein